MGPKTIGRGRLWHSMDAHAGAQACSADIAVTVCGGFTLNSGIQQHTVWMLSMDKEQWKNQRLSFRVQIPDNKKKLLQDLKKRLQ